VHEGLGISQHQKMDSEQKVRPRIWMLSSHTLESKNQLKLWLILKFVRNWFVHVPCSCGRIWILLTADLDSLGHTVYTASWQGRGGEEQCENNVKLCVWCVL